MLQYLLEDRTLIVNPNQFPLWQTNNFHKLINEKKHTEAKEISSTAHQSV